MAGPWEKYQQAAIRQSAEQAGPWVKYQSADPEDSDLSSVSSDGARASDFAKEVGAGALTGAGATVSGTADLIRPSPQERQPINTPNGEFMPLGDLIGKHIIDPVRTAISSAIDEPVRAAGQWLNDKGKALAASESMAAQRAKQASTPTGDLTKPSTWSMGEDPSLAGLGLHVANLAGQFAPQAGAMLATRGRAVQTPAMMGLGGLQAGGAAADEAEQRIAQVPDAALQETSSVYRDLRKSLDEPQAKQALITTARSAAFEGAAPVGALGGLATQVALGPMQKAIGGGLTRKLGISVPLEAGAEGLQEVGETIGARRATNQALGEQRDLTADTFGDFALGALGGAGHAGLGTALEREPAREHGQAGAPDRPAEAASGLALPALERLALPAPEQTFYADSQGNVQDVGPVRNVDGDMQPDLQGREWINPRNRADRIVGGEGMEAQVDRGEPAPLVGQIERAGRQGQAAAAREPVTIDAAPERAALPAPDSIVVDRQGNAQRGPTAPWVRYNDQGGRGMDQQAPTAQRLPQDRFEYLAKPDGNPFQAPGAAKASKAYREAMKAGRGPEVIQKAGGYVVRVPVEPARYEMRPLDAAAHEAATSPNNDLPAPTQAQIEAGNYKKGKIRLHGLDISIESPQGSERTGTSPDGTEWRHTMSDHYGYIKRTTGADGEQVDVYVGPQHDSNKAFVIDQLNQQDGSFDEHKVMLGYPDEASAVAAYRSNFGKGWKVGPVSAMSVDEFKQWLKDGNQTKPAATGKAADELLGQPEPAGTESPVEALRRQEAEARQAAQSARLKGDNAEGRHQRSLELQARAQRQGLEGLPITERQQQRLDAVTARVQEDQQRRAANPTTDQAPVKEAATAIAGAQAETSASDAKPRYRLDEPAQGPGAPLAVDVSAAIAASPELARVKVVQSFDDLPLSAKIQARRDGLRPDEVRGVYNGGHAYIVADNHADVADAVYTAVHEEVGHRGIRGLLGDELNPTMERIYASEAARAKGRMRIAQTREHYAKVLEGLGPEKQRLLIAEELVATLIESGDRSTALQRALSKIRELLRKLFPQVPWTYTDVLALGEQSRRWLQREQRVRAGAGDLYSLSAMKSVEANIRRGRAALARAITEKTSVHRAMFRAGLGWVDFVWGSEGRVKPSGKTAGAMGLSHILEARQRKDGANAEEALRLLDGVVEAVARGEEFSRNEIGASTRIGVEHGDTIVWLAKQRGGNAWVVTGYEKRPDGQAAGRATDRPTHAAASRTRDDVGAGVSNNDTDTDRVNKSSEPDDATLYSLRPNRPHTSDAFTDLSDDQKSALNKIAPRSTPERAIDWFKRLSDRAMLKIRQGLVDRYAALRDLDEAARGEDILSSSITDSSWVLARMSSAAGGALHAMLNNGRIYLDAKEKVIDMRGDGSLGLGAALARLGSAAEIERFMGWIAGNRSAKLAAEGRENLFTPKEIAALQTLNHGTTEQGADRSALYQEVFKEFQQYRDDVLAIAEQAGVISAESRALWRDEFYVPFYRVVDEDGFAGQKGSKGLTRQEAYKKLKGGDQNLNDLLQNTLMNFHHLLQASLKNQAATQAIRNAEQLGIADPVKETERDIKTSTFILKDGQKQWYEISDPLVYEALTSLADPGLNNAAVRMMSAFKRVFTNMTTVTPQFIIANLLRDSMSATATSEVGKNFLKNIAVGAKDWADAKKRARLLASGGAFSFGHIYSNDPDEVKANLTRDLRGAKLVSSPRLVPEMLKAGWDRWGALANTAENANRAAIFEQNQARGKLAAAFEARDLMDFSVHGAWPAVRFLIRVVPFLNARLQGLDKLYRSGVKPSLLVAFGKGNASDKEAAARFATVVGALSLASMALLLANNDDEEYRKLEEWEKDTYWHLFIGGAHWQIPKPFEVGAIATLAERLLQQAIDDKATGKLFAERLGFALTQTFSFSPVPQMAQPVLDVYSNKDSFTGRQIESAGMERLSLGLRAKATTTAPAKAVSWASRRLGDNFPLAVSPIQADHLIQGYLGQVGAWGAGIMDTLWRSANGETEPAKHWHEYQPIRRFYRDLDTPAAYTRYSTLFYEGLKEAGRVYADVKELRDLGRLDEARQVLQEKRDMLALRQQLNQVQRRLTKINVRMDAVRLGGLDADAKRRELDRLQVIKNRLTEMAGKRVEAVRAKR